MNNWSIQPRYWSPDQKYATGDVLITLLSEGWQMSGSTTLCNQGHALLHAFTWQRATRPWLYRYSIAPPCARYLARTPSLTHTPPEGPPSPPASF